MNIMKKLAGALGTVAPALATAVAGPAGPLAMAAVKAISGAVGAPEGAKVDFLVKSLTDGTADPERLRSADSEFRMKYEVELARIAVQDRDSARRMRVNLGGDATSAVMAYGGLIALLGIIAGYFVLEYQGDPIEHKELFMGLLTGVTTLVGSVFSFYFGAAHKNGG